MTRTTAAPVMSAVSVFAGSYHVMVPLPATLMVWPNISKVTEPA
jgi:hypothetical protein